MLLQAEFISTLMALIDINTSPPGVGGAPAQIERAQDLYAILAEGIGMRTVFSGQNTSSNCVNTKALWLLNQPHRVLEIGTGNVQHTLMFNFHMDTLGPHLAARLEESVDGQILVGRGVSDAKGPAVALLAAVAQILQQRPDIFQHIRIVIQMVGSAKDCAMNAQNTVALVGQGLYGHLNVFMQAHDAHHFENHTCARREALSYSGASANDSLNLESAGGHGGYHDFTSQADGIFSVVAQPVQNQGLNQDESIILNDLCRFMQDLGDLIVTFAAQRAGVGITVTAPRGMPRPMNRALSCVFAANQPAQAANGDNFRISR